MKYYLQVTIRGSVEEAGLSELKLDEENVHVKRIGKDRYVTWFTIPERDLPLPYLKMLNERGKFYSFNEDDLIFKGLNLDTLPFWEDEEDAYTGRRYNTIKKT